MRIISHRQKLPCLRATAGLCHFRAQQHHLRWRHVHMLSVSVQGVEWEGACRTALGLPGRPALCRLGGIDGHPLLPAMPRAQCER